MKKTAVQFLEAGLGIIVLMGTVLIWIWKSLPPKIPWFYSLPLGDQQLVDKIILVYVLAGTIVLLVITRLFSVWAGKDDSTVAVAIMAGGLTAAILLLATFFRVMQIFIGT